MGESSPAGTDVPSFPYFACDAGLMSILKPVSFAASLAFWPAP